VADREIQHLGSDKADVDDVGPSGDGTFDRGLGEESRMSRPTAICFGSNCSTYARPIAEPPFSSSSVG
jgi:hypothetical protein